MQSHQISIINYLESVITTCLLDEWKCQKAQVYRIYVDFACIIGRPIAEFKQVMGSFLMEFFFLMEFNQRIGEMGPFYGSVGAVHE